jgi:Domain of unknown function (DUF3067)
MTGEDLRQLVFNKWGCSYDVQIVPIKDKIYFQVMWKYLEQTSFHWTSEEYNDRLAYIAELITSWGVIKQVQVGILEAKNRPRLGKAVSFSLDLGERGSEWIIDG